MKKKILKIFSSFLSKKEERVTEQIHRERKPIEFTSGGSNYIYCNNPESVSIHKDDLKFLWYSDIGKKSKEIELYRSLINAQNSNHLVKTGIALKNTTDREQIVHYKYSFAERDTKGGDAHALVVTPVVLKSFFESEYMNVHIAPNSSIFLCGVESRFKVSHRKFSYIKASIKAEEDGAILLRTFAAGQNKLNDIDELFEIEKPERHVATQFSGELDYSEKHAIISVDPKYEYRIFEKKEIQNISEYSIAINTKENSKKYLHCNFGARYVFELDNVTDDTMLTISPDWSIKARRNATICYKIGDLPWQARNAIVPNMCWFFPLNSAKKFELSLPGGNHGDFNFFFSRRTK